MEHRSDNTESKTSGGLWLTLSMLGIAMTIIGVLAI